MSLANTYINYLLTDESIDSVSISGLSLGLNGANIGEITLLGEFRGLEYQAYIKGIRVGYDSQSVLQKDLRYVELASLDLDVWGTYSYEKPQASSLKKHHIKDFILHEWLPIYTNAEVILRRASFSYKQDELSKPLIEVLGGAVYNQFVSVNAELDILGLKSKLVIESERDRPLSLKLNAVQTSEDVPMLNVAIKLQRLESSEWDLTGNFNYAELDRWLQSLPESIPFPELAPYLEDLRDNNSRLQKQIAEHANQLLGESAFQIHMSHDHSFSMEDFFKTALINGKLKHDYRLINADQQQPLLLLNLAHQVRIDNGLVSFEMSRPSRLKVQGMQGVPKPFTELLLKLTDLEVQQSKGGFELGAQYQVVSATEHCKNIEVIGRLKLNDDGGKLAAKGELQSEALGFQSSFQLLDANDSAPVKLDFKGRIEHVSKLTSFLRLHELMPPAIAMTSGRFNFGGKAYLDGPRFKTWVAGYKKSHVQGWVADLELGLEDIEMAHEEYGGASGLNLLGSFTYDQAFVSVEPIRVRVDQLHVGIPVKNASLSMSLQPFSGNEAPRFEVTSAEAQVFGGRASVAKPFIWRLPVFSGGGSDLDNAQAEESRIELEFQDWELQQLVDLQKKGVIASGLLSGKLPVVLNDQAQLIVSGIASTKTHGVIQYRDEASQAVGVSNKNLGKVMSILNDFQYDSLKSSVELSPAGQLALGVQLSGRNPSFENGRQVNFNLNVENKNIFKTLEYVRLMSDFNKNIEGGLKGSEKDGCQF